MAMHKLTEETKELNKLMVRNLAKIAKAATAAQKDAANGEEEMFFEAAIQAALNTRDILEVEIDSSIVTMWSGSRSIAHGNYTAKSLEDDIYGIIALYDRIGSAHPFGKKKIKV